MVQMELFQIPRVEIEKSGLRRRSRTSAICDQNITSRADRLKKRNQALVARYYYWSEIKRRRFDDVVAILSDQEFFIEYRTISNALIEFDDFLSDMCRRKVTSRSLRKSFPGFCWD